MCNVCRYERRTHWDQYACFQCRMVKTRRRRKVSQFETSYGIVRDPQAPARCSGCGKDMVYVGPHFRAPKMRDTRAWNALKPQLLRAR